MNWLKTKYFTRLIDFLWNMPWNSYFHLDQWMRKKYISIFIVILNKNSKEFHSSFFYLILSTLTFYQTSFSENIYFFKRLPAKWSNTLKKFVGRSPINCLSVFDYFVGLVLKELIKNIQCNQPISYHWFLSKSLENIRIPEFGGV